MNQDIKAEKKVRELSILRALMKLWPFVIQQKKLFFITLIAVLCSSALARIAVNVFGYAIDNGILKNNRTVVIGSVTLFLVIELTRSGLSFAYEFLFEKLGNRILFLLRQKLIQHVQSLPLPYFDKNPVGRIVTRLTNDVVGVGSLFSDGIVNVFSAMVSFAMILFSMMAISIKMTAVTLIITPPIIIISYILSQKLLGVVRASKRTIASINSFVAESIGGMRVLQLYGRIDANVEHFKKLSDDYRTKQLRAAFLYALLWPNVNLFTGVAVIAALIAGGIISQQSELSTGMIIAFILHVKAFRDPLHQILEKYIVLQNSLSSIERVYEVLNEKSEAGRPYAVNSKSDIENRDNEFPFPIGHNRLRGDIVFHDVCFRYGPHLPNVLNNINLEIKHGESVALVGRTGSGKSTVISLLQRFYEPVSGTISIGDLDLNEIDRHFLRRQLGVVQQNTFLFQGTVADNISLGNPEISREQISRAAEMAGLSELIARQPKGLDAPVEERGSNLSFGEGQLIAFARILAYEPDILVLDEASANIDSHSEQLIQNATRKVQKSRTSIIVAHRLSTITDCDKIVVFDSGKIIEQGHHSELMARRGQYYAYYTQQSSPTRDAGLSL